MYVSKHICASTLMLGRVSVGVYLLCIAAWGQQLTASWQEVVRRYAEARDWSAAMAIVDREIDRAPQDMDVRAWRARVLMWSGNLAEAELEYHVLLAAAPHDPDNWLGLATVYSREDRPREALEALDRAVELDPKRTDIHIARARALRVLGSQIESRLG